MEKSQQKMIRALALIVCRINLIYMCLDNNNNKKISLGNQADSRIAR